MQTIAVIPVYNEARTLTQVLDRVAEYVDWLVVVDDGSRDATPHLLAEWAAPRTNVVVVTLAQNRGMAAALGHGFDAVLELYALGKLGADDIVVNLDADGQHRPEYIPAVVAAMEQRGLDVLLTQRDFSLYPRYKRWGNAFLSWYASILSGFPYHDVECGYRFLRVRVVADLMAYYTGVRYSCAQEIGIITARRGWKIANDFVAQVNYYRPGGTRARDGLTNAFYGLVALLRVWLNRPVRTPKPASRIVSLAGSDGMMRSVNVK